MVVPALLTDKKDELQRMLDSCGRFCDYAQIDIMDGEFVPSNSVSLEGLENIKAPKRCEGHLMVKEPLKWLDSFRRLGAQRIIYHFEIGGDHDRMISQIKQAGFSCGMGINPGTRIKDFVHLLSKLDCLLFLSVEPGFYGARFIPEVLDKIKEFKRLYPDTLVGIDGGIKPDNAALIKESGVDYICVGSAILKASDPVSAYKNFLNILNE